MHPASYLEHVSHGANPDMVYVSYGLLLDVAYRGCAGPTGAGLGKRGVEVRFLAMQVCCLIGSEIGFETRGLNKRGKPVSTLILLFPCPPDTCSWTHLQGRNRCSDVCLHSSSLDGWCTECLCFFAWFVNASYFHLPQGHHVERQIQA